MSEYLFGLHSGHLTDGADQIAGRHGACPDHYGPAPDIASRVVIGTAVVMRESHPAFSVHEFVPEDSDPVPADPALVAKLQQAAMLANENCDRAMALAHKLSTQLREAQSRINQLELEVDGLVHRLRKESETAVIKLQSDADARVDRTKREADERMARVIADAENRVRRLQGELVQARDRVKVEADAHIERIKIEADDSIARAEIEADARIERMKIEADDRVARAEDEAKKHLDRGRVEMEGHFSRLKADLAQAELRADRAEKWLGLIRQEIEERLMPSFVAMHDRSTPPERISLDGRPRG
jgi:hypothetical protein